VGQRLPKVARGWDNREALAAGVTGGWACPDSQSQYITYHEEHQEDTPDAGVPHGPAQAEEDDDAHDVEAARDVDTVESGQAVACELVIILVRDGEERGGVGPVRGGAIRIQRHRKSCYQRKLVSGMLLQLAVAARGSGSNTNVPQQQVPRAQCPPSLPPSPPFRLHITGRVSGTTVIPGVYL
jgi:hypothetical protein